MVLMTQSEIADRLYESDFDRFLMLEQSADDSVIDD